MCKSTKITSSGSAGRSSTYFMVSLLLTLHHPLCHYFTRWRLVLMYSTPVWSRSAMFTMHSVALTPVCEVCISSKQPHSRILVPIITTFTVCSCRRCHGKKSSALRRCLIVIMPPSACCPPEPLRVVTVIQVAFMNSTVCCCGSARTV